MRPRRAVSGHGALTRAFVVRFFDNEITGGSQDLLHSFFWIISFLAVPGFLLAFMASFRWQLIANVRGPEVLEVLARPEKLGYVTFALISAGAMSVLVWNSLLVDRRDALVLGAQPVAPSAVVRAKLAALAIYAGLLAAASHVLSALAFGVMLAHHSPFTFLLRGIAAHFVASFLAAGFVFLSAAAVQGLCLAVLGPRFLARTSPLLQIALVAAVLLGILNGPELGAMGVVPGSHQGPTPGLDAPAMWFFGVYEVMLGVEEPAFDTLAWVALGAVGAALLTTVITFPLAYRRLMTDAIERPGGYARTGWRNAAADVVTRALQRHQPGRGVLQFALATLARSESHRFAVATAAGLVVAAALPTLSASAAQTDVPRGAALALPVASMVFVLIGIRTAIAMPANLGASWLFRLIDVPAPRIRSASVTLLVGCGVMPVVLLMAPVTLRAAGWRIGLVNAALCVLLGSLGARVLASGQQAAPCTYPWRPERAALRQWWPAYGIGFVVLLQVVTSASVALASAPGALALVVVALLGAHLWLIRRNYPAVVAETWDEPPPTSVLSLD